MKTTIGKLADGAQSLDYVMHGSDVLMSFVDQYWLERLLDVMVSKAKYLSTKRNEMVKRFGTPVIRKEKKIVDGKETGEMEDIMTDMFSLSKENAEKFNKEMEALRSVTVSIEYEPRPLSILKDISMNPSQARISLLAPFFMDDVAGKPSQEIKEEEKPGKAMSTRRGKGRAS